jgi:hypothetical protein
LDQPQIALLLLKAAAEHVAIEVSDDFEIGDPNDDMVDLANVDLHERRPLAGSVRMTGSVGESHVPGRGVDPGAPHAASSRIQGPIREQQAE